MMTRLLLVLILLCPLLIYAQLSPSTIGALPDSVRPKNSESITKIEAARIIYYAQAPNSLTGQDYSEIDKLTLIVADFQKDDPKPDIIKYADLLSRYWGNRKEATGLYDKNLIDSSAKYNEIMKGLIGRDGPRNMAYRVKYHARKGFQLMETNEFGLAFSEFKESISLAKKSNDLHRTAMGYLHLGELYSRLHLPERALPYLDSCKTILFTLRPFVPKEAMFYWHWVRAALASQRLVCLGDIWELDRKQTSYFDSVQTHYRQIVQDRDFSWNPKYGAYKFMTQIAYKAKNYKNSIAFADSAYAMMPGDFDDPSGNDVQIFKGLSLAHLGKKEKGLRLIAEKEKTGLAGITRETLLEELYLLQKKLGNKARALSYLEKLVSVRDSSQLARHSGEVLLLQQQNEIAGKDLRILRLREQERRTSYIIFAILICGSLLTVYFINSYRDNRQKTRQLLSQLSDITEFQILRIEDEREKERKRLGQELHDQLSGTIAASVRMLRMKAREHAPIDKDWLLEVCDILAKGYDSARGKSHELYLEEGSKVFWSRLEESINFFFNGTGMSFSFQRDTSPIPIPAEIGLAILQIIREAITNVIKHARANTVDILIFEDQGILIVEVQDDGKGMSKKSENKGIGLKSIEERMFAIGGKLRIKDNEPRGFVLTASIPLPLKSDLNTRLNSGVAYETS